MPEKPLEPSEDEDDEPTPFERFENFAKKLVASVRLTSRRRKTGANCPASGRLKAELWWLEHPMLSMEN